MRAHVCVRACARVCARVRVYTRVKLCKQVDIIWYTYISEVTYSLIYVSAINIETVIIIYIQAIVYSLANAAGWTATYSVSPDSLMSCFTPQYIITFRHSVYKNGPTVLGK